MNSAADKPKKPKLRWYQYSLRSLLALTTLVAMAGSWFSWKRRQVERRRAAVAAIVQFGGMVDLDYELDEDGFFNSRSPTPPGPAWVRNLLGDDFFAQPAQLIFHDVPLPREAWPHIETLTTLQAVRFMGTTVDDDDLAHLAGLRQLKTLTLSDLSITGSGLRHVADLPHLRKLVLTGSPVTNDNLRYVAAMKRLRALDLTNTRVTNAGLSQLQALADLERLWLGRDDDCTKTYALPRAPTLLEQFFPDADQLTTATPPPPTRWTLPVFQALFRYLGFRGVTDAGLAHLKTLPRLHELVLSGDGFSDAALTRLRDFPQLSDLSLRDTRVSDAGLARLRALPHLEYLAIVSDDLTDRGLGTLEEMVSLKEVHLETTRTTRAGAARLRKALPTCSFGTDSVRAFCMF